MRRVLLLAAVLLPPAAARLRSQDTCDPDLAGRGVGGYGYQPRGPRCEGLFRHPAGGSVLYLVSLTQSFGNLDTTSREPLVVRWPDAGGDTVRLRAEGLRADLYYRMDATRPATDQAFDWPTDVLTGLHIPTTDLGVLGWTTRALAGVAQPVYLPLQIAQRGGSASCGTLRLLLWAGQRLDSVTMSIAPLSASGVPGAWITHNRELGLGYYPSQRPVEVPLPPLAPGIHAVRFVAYPRNGAATPLSYLVQQPAARPDCGP